MAAVLVTIAVMMVAMTAALPVMRTTAQREKEAELIFRGKQYARAISAFQRRTGAYPPTVDALVTDRFLRRKYKDPITNEDFVLLTQGSELPAATSMQIPGVASSGAAGRGGTSTTTGGRTGGTQTTAGRGTSSTTTSSFLSGQSGTGTSSTANRTGLQAGATTGILGVHSKSTEKAFRVYNGFEHYNEWVFFGTQASAAPGGVSGGGAGRGTRGGGAGVRGGQPVDGRGNAPAGGRGTTPAGGRGNAPNPFGTGGTRGNTAPPLR